jgi:hypothetical protein
MHSAGQWATLSTVKESKIFPVADFLHPIIKKLPGSLTQQFCLALKVEFFFKCHSRVSLPAARQLAGIYIKRPFHGFRVKHGMTFFPKAELLSLSG